MSDDLNCIFCKIAKGALPAKIADENQDFVAFYDVNPMAPVHVLIIPKIHVESVRNLGKSSAEVLGGMADMANAIALQLNLSSGFRLVINTGRDSGQTVFHLHMHLLGGRQLDWPPG